VEIVSFPSEKEPAPPHPARMSQGLHFLQPGAASELGQLRFSMLLPRSIITTLSSGLWRISSRAQKIPDGPLPTIATS